MGEVMVVVARSSRLAEEVVDFLNERGSTLGELVGWPWPDTFQWWIQGDRRIGGPVIDDGHLREVVNRYIRLKEEKRKTKNYVKVESTLSLVDRHGNEVMSLHGASLRAAKNLLEMVLMDVVSEAVLCPDCGTSKCAAYDGDLCEVIQVMRS